MAMKMDRQLGGGENAPPKVWLAEPAGQLGESPGSEAIATHEQVGPCILLLVDDADLGEWLLEEFRQAGATVALATTGRDGLALLRSGVVDVLISEMGLPDLPGIDLLRALRGLPRVPKVILTTDRRSDFLARRAIEHGASAVVSKPFGMEQLLALVKRLLAN